MTRSSWPLYEVFVRSKRGLNHVHVGSLHAPDAEMALRNARDLYTRRNEGVSIWVVPAEEITASLRLLSPDDPVRYDFALCHYGMSGLCPIKPKPTQCEGCALLSSCAVGPRVLRRVRA